MLFGDNTLYRISSLVCLLHKICYRASEISPYIVITSANLVRRITYNARGRLTSQWSLRRKHFVGACLRCRLFVLPEVVVSAQSVASRQQLTAGHRRDVTVCLPTGAMFIRFLSSGEDIASSMSRRAAILLAIYCFSFQSTHGGRCIYCFSTLPQNQRYPVSSSEAVFLRSPDNEQRKQNNVHIEQQLFRGSEASRV